MKRLSLTLLLILFATGLKAQNYDSRLLNAYSASELEGLQKSDTEKLSLISYALENGMYVSDNGNVKGGSLPEIEMPSSDATFADLGIQIKNENQYFQIKGEDKILVVKSFWVLNNELETK